MNIRRLIIETGNAGFATKQAVDQQEKDAVGSPSKLQRLFLDFGRCSVEYQECTKQPKRADHDEFVDLETKAFVDMLEAVGYPG